VKRRGEREGERERERERRAMSGLLTSTALSSEERFEGLLLGAASASYSTALRTQLAANARVCALVREHRETAREGQTDRQTELKKREREREKGEREREERERDVVSSIYDCERMWSEGEEEERERKYNGNERVCMERKNERTRGTCSLSLPL
jgi:hypothetical protein